MISSFCLYLSFSWDGRILKKTSLILTTYYLELGLNIHGWKKPLFDHCKRGTASKQPPRSLLRTARRKKKAQRPTHAYSKALECAAQARARKRGAARASLRGLRLGARLLGERNYSGALSLRNPLELHACARVEWRAGQSERGNARRVNEHD